MMQIWSNLYVSCLPQTGNAMEKPKCFETTLPNCPFGCLGCVQLSSFDLLLTEIWINIIPVTINSVVESEETINNKQLHLCECVYRFPGCSTRSPKWSTWDMHCRLCCRTATQLGCRPRFHGWMSEPENPAVLTRDHAGTSPAFRGDTVKHVICQKQSVCYLLH